MIEVYVIAVCLIAGFLKYFYEADGHGINAVPKAVIPMSSYTVR